MPEQSNYVSPVEAPTRLNPVCPVCGEDEPEIRTPWYIHTEAQQWARRAIWVSPDKLGCICRRCEHQWEVEPLSKPWDDSS